MTELRVVQETEQEPEPETSGDFLSLYLQYTGDTECPSTYHRWTALTSLAAWIGRDIYFPFGHFKIHANMYNMLIGLAGTRKSTAIKIGTNVLKAAGYTKFAAKKTRQEKFLIDLSGQEDESLGEADILDANIFGGDSGSKEPAEVFVAADEVNNFIGVGNMDFMSILGDLWDTNEDFDYKLKNSKSVHITLPTITILGGNTFAGLNRLFPPEAIEQGFFSRTLFIYAEPVGRKYSIPPEPDDSVLIALVEQLHQIKQQVQGKISISSGALALLDRIYMEWEGMEDIRFDSYENRRSIHLIKLAMLIMATRISTEISERDIVEANTILTYTESLMSKALGEFGKARNSDVTHKVMSLLDSTLKPLSLQDVWKIVHQDLERRDQLIEILGNLIVAEKIQHISTKEVNGYLPIKRKQVTGIEGAVDWSILTTTERDLL